MASYHCTLTECLEEDRIFLVPVWGANYEKPMKTGYKQGEMRLTCFSKIGTAPEAEQLFLLSCLHSEKQECRFLLLQCHAPP
jgi:hypothetical protein